MHLLVLNNPLSVVIGFYLCDVVLVLEALRDGIAEDAAPEDILQLHFAEAPHPPIVDDCDLDDMAQADSADVDMLKKAVSKGQLKGKGIGCFVVSGGRTTFKRGTRDECLKAKSSSSGSTMYVLEDENKAGASRMMRAVEGEGLPLLRDPYQFGNLFLQMEIVFPDEVTEEVAEGLKKFLPPALNSSSADETAENVDTHEATFLDPVASYKDGTFSTKDAMDSDDDEGGMGGQRVQCAQQ